MYDKVPDKMPLILEICEFHYNRVYENKLTAAFVSK